MHLRMHNFKNKTDSLTEMSQSGDIKKKQQNETFKKKTFFYCDHTIEHVIL